MQNQDENNMLDFTALIKELEIDKMSPSEQEQVFSDILDAVNLRVLTRISKDLTEDQRQKLKADLMNDPQQAQAIIMGMIPKEQQLQIYQQEIEAVKNEIKDASEQEV